MIIQENISLAQYTTFKIGGPARFFCLAETEEDICEAVIFAKKHEVPFFVLGGGSNLLISDNGFAGLVIKVDIRGLEVKSQKSKVKSEKHETRDAGVDDDHTVILSAGAGEEWDSFVEWTVSRGYSGLENLSAIPGTVGAAPVQNLGAYGAEAKESIYSVRVFDTRKMAFAELSNKDCKFAYRDSMFKHKKGRYIVTRVDFRLSRDGKVNIGYKDLKRYFADRSKTRSTKSEGDPSIEIQNPQESIITVITPANVRAAVIDIRWNKLPDWKLWGTAGSFFKNPVVSKLKFARLKKKYPDLPGFPETSGKFGLGGKVKIPLGWVLDNICHVKGMQKGAVGTYEKQALVFVAKPGATAAEIVALAQEIMEKVKDATGITIEGEVEWVN